MLAFALVLNEPQLTILETLIDKLSDSNLKDSLLIVFSKARSHGVDMGK